MEAVKSSDNMVFIVEDGRDFEDEQRYLKCLSVIVLYSLRSVVETQIAFSLPVIKKCKQKKQ